ncbi:MAG TPA: thioesterase family protein [Moraxellaceae bacterium]|jgi:acyl-coenzyme A thioesterase PaaI-like protein|nr:thioesterase family protein [Moraxellaceae bacterium]
MSQSDTTTAPRTEMTPEEKGQLLLDRLKSAFDNTPFVRVIGLELTHASTDVVTARFDMKPELVGNTIKQILHGGVIATALDMVGGMMGLVAIYPRMKEDGVPREERYLRLTRLGTIDMRVDYLAPGRGLHFEATATLLRVGKKVLVTRMELRNDSNDLIAAATGTYLY